MAIPTKMNAIGVAINEISKINSVSGESVVELSKAFSVLNSQKIIDLASSRDLSQAAFVEAVSRADLTDKIKEEIIEKYANVVATKAQKVATDGATGSAWSFKAAVTGLADSFKALSMASKVLLVITAVVTAYQFIKRIVDQVTVSLEEQRQKVKDLKEEYENSISEISSLEDEMAGIDKRIQEINALPSLSLTDKDELEYLQNTNAELQTRIALLEQERDIKRSELDSATKAEYEKDMLKSGEKQSLYKTRTVMGHGQSFAVPINVTEEEYAKEAIQRFGELNKLKAEGKELTEQEARQYEELKADLNDIGIRYSGWAQNYSVDDETRQSWVDFADLISRTLDPEWWFERTKSANAAIIQEYEQAVSSGDQSVIATAFAKIQEAAEKAGLSVEEFLERYTSTPVAGGGFVKNFAKSLEDLNNTIDTVQSAFKSLKSAQEEYNETGKFSIDTLQELLTLGPEYLGVLIDENGRINLNSDAVAALVNEKTALIKALAAEQVAAYAVTSLQELMAESTETVGNKSTDAVKGIENAATAMLNMASSGITAATGVAALDSALDGLANQQGAKGVDLEAWKHNVQDYASSISSIINSTGNSISGWSGRSAKSSTGKDAWSEAYEKEAKELKYSLNLRQITLQEYYDKMTALNEKYFAGRSKYIDQYRDNIISLESTEKEIYENRRKYTEHQISMLERQNGTTKEQVRLYVELLDTVEAEIQSAYAKGYTDNDDHVQSLQKQWADYADSVIGIHDEIIDAANASIDFQIDDLKKEMDKATSAIQSRIDSLRRQQDNNKKANQDRIDVIDDEIGALQNRIDLLREENDAIDEANELLELRQKLENAKNQKNTRVYHEDKGWVWEANQSDIEDAQDAYDSALRNKAINDIRSQIDTLKAEKERLQSESENYLMDEIQSLESQLENTRAYYNKRISQLEEYGDKWDQIRRDVKRTHTQMLLDQYNINTQESVAFEERLATLADFVTRYNRLIASLETVDGGSGESTSLEGGYAKGTTRVPKSGNYVVNEGGLDELIASTVGGQIVNLRSADAVYPASATETLMKIGNNPLEFMSDMIPSVLKTLNSTLPLPTQGSLKPGLSDDILGRLGSIMNNMRIPASSGEMKQSRDIIFHGPVTMRTSANNMDSLARDINLYYPNRKK